MIYFSLNFSLVVFFIIKSKIKTMIYFSLNFSLVVFFLLLSIYRRQIVQSEYFEKSLYKMVYFYYYYYYYCYWTSHVHVILSDQSKIQTEKKYNSDLF
ncbi:hypothetical protein BY996DRAFT_7756508 [Phakopsora pachyrhizi]|nr:hypothetical protein BY996DRAFT_7756508 [Phakopsora pachyrhizi]